MDYKTKSILLSKLFFFLKTVIKNAYYLRDETHPKSLGKKLGNELKNS